MLECVLCQTRYHIVMLTLNLEKKTEISEVTCDKIDNNILSRHSSSSKQSSPDEEEICKTGHNNTSWQNCLFLDKLKP